MPVFSRMLVAVAAAAAVAAAVAVEPTAAGWAQDPQLRDAICRDSSCAADEGGAGVQLLQHKASAAAVSEASSGRQVEAASRPTVMSPGMSALLQTINAKNHADKAQTGKPFDCVKWPQYCGAPLHCEDQPVTIGEELSWIDHFAEGGHSSLKIWCASVGSFAEGIVKECLKNHDLSKAGHLTYEEQGRNYALEADGSYCFLVGHCDNDKVTNETTLAEADAMCDAKYGHDAWAKIGIKDIHPLLWILQGKVSLRTGFHDRATADMGAKLACAMGNYHCDVIYCRENYCNKPYYQQRYGSYAKQDPPPEHGLLR